MAENWKICRLFLKGSGGMLPHKIFENCSLRSAMNAFPAMLDHVTESEELCNGPKEFCTNQLSSETQYSKLGGMHGWLTLASVFQT